ncbi:PIN-like domain-containing protein, partial [Acinetobacter baumannii]|nr:PIN-like domain-containing protein [Acinetobacter baumannii]
MNKLFIEYKDYYQLNELTTLFNNKDSLIIFDTNIFLDLYSYPLDTRNSILDSIDKIVGNLWSPHNIFLEYHKNRREVIYKSKKILDEIKNTLGSFSSDNILKINAIATYQSKYGKFHSE